MISFVRRNAFELILGLLIIAFTVYFSFIAINRFHTFRSNYFDLGIMDQVVYNTSQGRFLEMTNQELRTNVSRFAIHFDPLLAFFAPIYIFYAHPNVLLIAQVAIIGLGAYAVFLIAKTITKSKLAAFLFAVSFLFYHPIQRAVIFDFHSVVFATTFLLYAIYFSLKKRYLITLLFVFLALLTKEHVGLITFFFGGYIFLFQKERKYGFIIAGISLLFFVATFFYIIPTARMSAHFALQFFEDVGGESPSSVAINILKNPLYIWEKISTDQALNYLRGLFFLILYLCYLLLWNF